MRAIKSRLAVLEASAARTPRTDDFADFAVRACRRAVLSNTTADILSERWPELLRRATEQERQALALDELRCPAKIVPDTVHDATWVRLVKLRERIHVNHGSKPHKQR